MTATGMHEAVCDTVSVVIPVYRGGQTLRPLVDEICRLAEQSRTPCGRLYRVAEIILVWDGGDEESRTAMDEIAAANPLVRLIWLSRNFGQHAATLAGVASTTSHWVVTMDEDGEHDPACIARFVDTAIESGAQLVYGRPVNAASHGLVRNCLSGMTKHIVARLLLPRSLATGFHSFRLIDGEIARGLAAYCGYNIYLDVALAWVTSGSAHCPITLRRSARKSSGYDARRLLSHFWRLVLTSGTKPLRAVALLGLIAMVFAAVYSVSALWGWIAGRVPIQGFTTIVILLSFFLGAVMFSLGVIAEYLGMAVSVMIGRPPYLVVTRPPPTVVRQPRP